MMTYSFFSTLLRSKRSFIVLQISIITISLIPLVLVQQVTKSMVEEISNRIIETSSGHIMLLMPSSQENTKRIKEAKTILENFSEIQNIFAEISGGGILRHGTQRSGITIRGVEASFFEESGFKKYVHIEEGRLAFENEKSILLGKAAAEKISARVGDAILLLTARSNTPSALPKITRFIVSGIVSVGYEELDRAWAFVPFARAKTLFAAIDQNTSLKLKIDDPFSISNPLIKRAAHTTRKSDAFLSTLKKSLANYGIVFSWYERDIQRYTLFVETKYILSAVMIVAVILAAITLSSTMSMRIIDLQTDIAILKALGSPPKKLEQQIFLYGLTSGIISASLGIAGGIAINAMSNTLISWADAAINAVRYIFGKTDTVHLLNAQYYLTHIPFHIYWWDLLPIALLAIVFSIGASYLPARKIRSIPALKIIRNH